MFQAAYLIRHPLGYIRESRKSLLWICAATFLAIFILLPITIAHFWFLFPSDIKAKYPVAFQTLVVDQDNQYYFYDKHIKLCYRWFFPGTIDYRLIVYFIHSVNYLAVAFVATSFLVIAHAIVKSRASSLLNATGITESERTRRRETRRKVLKIASRTVISTTVVFLPWLPSMILSTLIDIAGFSSIDESIGRDWSTNLLRWNQYMYYIATWLFPLMVMLTDPKISRITGSLCLRLRDNLVRRRAP